MGRDILWCSVRAPEDLWFHCGASGCHEIRHPDTSFVVFQSPSWGMAAPPPPTACTPFCTSTPVPSRSRPCAGRTASSEALWGLSWWCRAMAAAWVRTQHTHTRMEVSDRKADAIQEQTGNVSRSWDFTFADRFWALIPWTLSRPAFYPRGCWMGELSQTLRSFLRELTHHSQA